MPHFEITEEFIIIKVLTKITIEHKTMIIIIVVILFAQIMSKQIHWRQYNGTVCEQDIPGSYEH